MSKNILPAFLSIQGKTLSDDEKRMLEKYNPLGVCYFAKWCANIESAKQVAELSKAIKETIGRDNVLIAVDQEGGRVRRLMGDEFADVSAEKDITTPEQAEQHAYLISADLYKCGINVNFAPVLDVEYEFTSKALQGRCFGNDEQKIAELGQIMINTYMEKGICPCVKHLPGHGRGVSDPHLELPILTESADILEKDFYPFKVNNQTPMGMVAHLALQQIDKDVPATMSKKVIHEIIREKIGFNGLLVSDAINMQALKGSIAERANAVLDAGCEVVCLGNTGFADNWELCQSKINMTDEAYEKLQNIAKICSKKVDLADYEHIKNKYCENLKSVVAYDYNYDATEVLHRLRTEK